MKQRSIGMCILLSIVTCGIYGLYWFVCITDDTNEMAGENDLAGGGMALLLTIEPVAFMDGTGRIRWAKRWMLSRAEMARHQATAVSCL